MGVAARRKILIILLGAIGDVVRALPLLGRLRAGVAGGAYRMGSRAEVSADARTSSVA